MKKILIIEDNYMMRMFLINYLGRSYDVTAVESPHRALPLQDRGEQFDLIISDYYPEDKGESIAFQLLTSQIDHEETSLFVLTDHDKSEQRISALSNGARDTLSKPFNPQELRLRVSSVLNENNQFTGLRTVA